MPTNQFELPVEKLRKTYNPDQLGFESTCELEQCADIVGQKRAMDALKLGLEISSTGYNIFVTGYVGTGRTTAVKCLLDELEKDKKTPDDILYVNNFSDPDSPRLIRLAPGKGDKYAQAMDEYIEHLKKNIPVVFENEAYQTRKNNLVESFKEKSANIAREFEKKLATKSFGLVQVLPVGKPELIYIIDKQQFSILSLADLVEEKKLSKEAYDKIHEQYLVFSKELDDVFKKIRSTEKDTRQALIQLDQDTVKPVVQEHLKEIKDEFNSDKITEYVAEVEKEILSNIERFLPKDEKVMMPYIDTFLEFKVNVVVDNSKEKGAPVIFENTPTFKNLFGTIERVWDRNGQWRTDFTKIKAGSLLKADGGYLVINALDAVIEPGVWSTLKRTLRNRILEISSYDPYAMLALSALKPESVPIDLKVIMIGDAYVYNVLYENDEDFKKVFKVRADFDWVMPVNDETVSQYAKVIKSISDKEKLMDFDKTAVASLVEYGIRLGGRKNHLSTQFNVIADILKEANYWAKKDKVKIVTNKYVDKAIEERIERVSMVEDKIQEMIDEGTIFIDTQGSVIGQVNGLSVYETGEYSFGRPSRITAKTAVGTSGVINIEREAELSGPIHSKGVFILSGYLRHKYAQDKPLVLSASLCFEQSYGGVEGDSASSAELYALISSLSELPIRQDLAVTGSVNQKGEVQPIGGVNQKIEGFYAVCKAKGLTGTQGVIIPETNVDDLMLRQEVIDAVKQGKFHIYSVKRIDEGIELLTGVKAGDKDDKGDYPKASINFLANDKLKKLAQAWKEFRAPDLSSTSGL